MNQPHIEMNKEMAKSEGLRYQVAYALNHHFAKHGTEVVAHGVGDWMNHPDVKAHIHLFPLDKYGNEVKDCNGYRKALVRIHIDDGTGEHKCDRICRIEDGRVNLYRTDTGKRTVSVPMEPEGPTPTYQWEVLIIPGKNIDTNAEEVNKILREQVKKIDVRTTTKISNLGQVIKIPNYLPRIGEWYGAIMLNEKETDGYWMVTDLRDTDDPVFGDLKGKQGYWNGKKWRGKTASDILQLQGFDLTYHPNKCSDLNTSVKRGLDVKADYQGQNTGQVPVECFNLWIYKDGDTPEYEVNGWVHKNPDVDILYLVGERGWIISKAALHALMKKYPRESYPDRYIPNDYPIEAKSSIADIYKVNFYVTIDELDELASERHTLPSDYMDLIRKKTKTLVNGDRITKSQYKFLEYCNPDIPFLSSLRKGAKSIG